MKRVAVFVAILVAVQCLALARAQTFACDSKASLFDDVDVRAEATASTRRLEDGAVAAKKGSSSIGVAGFVPRASDHDLILGDCEGGDFTDSFNFTECIYPEFLGGNRTYTTTVYFTTEDTITCIRVIDVYFDDEGNHLGGYPFLDEGGIGFDFVQFLFVSQEDQEMKFFIDILYLRVP